MTREKIIEDLKDFLVDDLFLDVERDQIGVDQGFQTVLGVDSLGFVELMAFVEDHYAIKIEESEFIPANFQNITSLSNLVLEKLG